MRNLFVLLSVLLIGAAASPLAGADNPVYPVNINAKGLALKGYDPVAYFTVGKPTRGSAEFEYEWEGAKYRFADAANRDLFQADPEKYAPQYGGYCAYAVSRGHTAGISTSAWAIHGGKLYLNHRFAKGKFNKDVPGAIARADENWPKIPKRQ